jgi:hypothetical protein
VNPAPLESSTSNIAGAPEPSSPGQAPELAAKPPQEPAEAPPPETAPVSPPARPQVTLTVNDDRTDLATASTGETGEGHAGQDEDGFYEGTVRLMVESRGSIRLLMTFVGELRQNPQYRLLRLVANQHKEGMDVWLGLREPVSLKELLLAMSGVERVATVTEFAPAENEHLLCVQLSNR